MKGFVICLLILGILFQVCLIIAKEKPYRDKMTPIGWNRIDDYAYRIVTIDESEYVLLDYGNGCAICKK